MTRSDGCWRRSCKRNSAPSTVVENRTGGAGLVGTNAVIQAEPDGYTLLASAFNTAVMPMVIKGATFDPEVDLEVHGAHRGRPARLRHDRPAPAERPRRDARRREGRTRRSGCSRSPRSARPGIWRRSTSCAAPASSSTSCPIAARTPALTDIMGGNRSAADRPELRAAAGREDGTRARALGIATEDALGARARASDDGRAGLPGFEFNSWYGVWAPEGHAARHLRRRSTA